MASIATSSPRHDPGYHWTNAEHDLAHSYLLPAVQRILAGLNLPEKNRRILDLGCGNGSMAAHLAAQGYEVVGVDPSEEGIAHGRKAYPHLQLHHGSCYDNLAEMH